jgi:hypothetical protein
MSFSLSPFLSVGTEIVILNMDRVIVAVVVASMFLFDEVLAILTADRLVL